MKKTFEFYDKQSDTIIKLNVSDAGVTGKDLLLAAAEQYVNEIKGLVDPKESTSLNREACLSLTKVLSLNVKTKPMVKSSTSSVSSFSSAGGTSVRSNTAY